MRSCTGTPDNDLDHAEWQNGRGSTISHWPRTGPPQTAAEMAGELRRILGPTLDKMRGVTQSAHRCEHGIDLERAACGQCMAEDEEVGVAMAARFEGRR